MVFEMSNRSIGIGVIGYGYWGPNLVRNFAHNGSSRVVAVADLDAPKLALSKRRHPEVETTSNFQDLLLNPAIDAVAIAKPVHTHFDLALAALKAGKHVFVEKPLAPTSEQVRRLRSAQETWARLPVHRRLRPVRALRRLLVVACDGLCDAVAADLGKGADETLAGEVLPLADACLFLERQAAPLLRPRRVPTGLRPWWLFGQSDVVHRRPRGVVQFSDWFL